MHPKAVAEVTAYSKAVGHQEEESRIELLNPLIKKIYQSADMSSKASSQGPWMRSRGSSWIKAGPIIAYIACSALLIVVEAEVSVEGYEKIGTQYMLSGIQVKEEPLCAILEKFGPVIMNPHDTETTNFKMECPIVKGTYFLKNFRTDEKNFPEDVPGNNWRFDVKGRYPEMVDTTLFHLQTYLKVERDVAYWKPGAK
ncbi:uncharacterized protein LOC124155023 isoform X2 [Ischnura elegans]|uniref:uncharacterized protein LOC124155023 isoform X2 n=1 Tax=Ischnura elegans TaxID=197161 RepID=UPI001ED88985|nr:uncharacterized protein LOC124155023 isoform X2 [Ischnura elegans]